MLFNLHRKRWWKIDKRLNIRQRKFVDEYIISGNAKQSAIKAGYSKKTAEVQGSRLLSDAKVSQAVKERTEEVFNEKAMTVAEAIAISSSIARGEPQRKYYKEKDLINDKINAEVERWTTPSEEDRQRSIEHILKISGAYDGRMKEKLTEAQIERIRIDTDIKRKELTEGTSSNLTIQIVDDVREERSDEYIT